MRVLLDEMLPRKLKVGRRYGIRAPLHGDDLFCDVGYQLGRLDESTHASLLRIPADGYPVIYVFLEAQPGATAREASVSAMKEIALKQGWEAYNLDDPTGWAGVRQTKSLAEMLAEEDRIAAVKRFFIESIHQLRDELTAFKEEHPYTCPGRGDEVWRGCYETCRAFGCGIGWPNSLATWMLPRMAALISFNASS